MARSLEASIYAPEHRGLPTLVRREGWFSWCAHTAKIKPAFMSFNVTMTVGTGATASSQPIASEATSGLLLTAPG